MTDKQKWALYALVFIGGGVLMVLEIAGGRLLAPFFGSDIFVWGSIIGVFMVALALGYYLGGRTADRRPFLAALAAVEIAAGITLMVLPALGSPLCGWISRSEMGARSAPFLSALLLFTIPSVLLAIASPFAVRIAARAVEKVGNVAGSLYALSTGGSILGTLLAAFVLIPAAGTRGIIFWAGMVELVTALAVFVIAGGLKRKAGKIAAAGSVLLACLIGLLLYPRGPGVPLDMRWERDKKISVLEADDAALNSVGAVLKGRGYRLELHTDSERVLKGMEKERADLLIVGEGSLGAGRPEFLRKLQGLRWRASPLLVLCKDEQVAGAAFSGYKGTVDALARTAPETELVRRIRRLVGQHELMHCEESPYHLILVTEQDYHDAPKQKVRRRRVLRFNNRVESAVFVDDLDEEGRPRQYESAVSYTALLHMGIIFQPEAKNALFIGLGGGIGPTEYHRHYGVEVDAVDIDPAVARVAQEYFFLEPSERLKVHVADGRRYLERTAKRHDMIVLDAYSSAGRIPFQLVTREFFSLVRSRLSETGVVVSNVISTISPPRNQVYLSIYRTLYAAGFSNVYVFPRFPLKVEEPFYREKYKLKDNYRIQDLPMNVILVATQDAERLEKSVVKARAGLLVRRKVHPAVLPHFEEYASFFLPMKHTRPGDVINKMEDGVIFTDNYAPTDLMFAGL